MNIDTSTVFNILKERVQNGKAKVLTYSELSQAYYDQTDIYHEPHGSWDAILGSINNALNIKLAPPISALVILKGKNEEVIRSKDNPNYCSLSVNGVYFLNEGNEPYSMVLACADL